jgi:CDP-glucose 4,6-dehydratase
LRNPGYIRPWQHVLEALAGYLQLCVRLAQSKERHGHSAWNFAPNPEAQVRVQDFVQAMIDSWGSGASIRVVEAPDCPETASLLLDNAKACGELGWRPLLRLEQTIGLTTDWYKAFVRGASARNLCLSQIERYQDTLLANSRGDDR